MDSSKKISCQICEKSFSTDKNKDKHIRMVHGVLKIFEFNVCNKYIGQKENLKSHIENNHKIKYHNCKICGKSFATSRRLRDHGKNFHEGAKNVKCDSCEQSFTNSGNLNTHIKNVHEGQRNHKCDFCGKFFQSMGDLNRHIKTIHEKQFDYNSNAQQNAVIFLGG